ncbi:flagellar hook-length control protein FliK [Nitrosovibrio sp. Nv4]|uniref:flagellar hook-length control protein FliK n=1 Tax=Nitrosovibrio sp. Nv4 TaxID=1945880 RepID=UPI000BD55E4C|nr:flagellar hook-length control protein FliK [Nitrosovibrio sp. Nv4]SOD41583.1 flagellar hook-length control protein FliK [Nitrosovibrio sp. Nv4]
MLTSPMLPNSTSSPVSQIKSSGPASDAADAGGAGQAGFSEVLEHEMNGKGDVPGVGSSGGNAAQTNTSDDTAMRTEQMADRNAEIQKDGKDAETPMAVATILPPSIALANVLSERERVAGYSPKASTGNHVDASGHALTDASVNLTPEVPQAELAAIVAQQGGAPALQPGLVATRPAEAGTGAESSTAGVRGIAPGTAQLSASVLAEISTETSVDVLATEMAINATGMVTTARQVEAARAVIGDGAPIRMEPAAAQGASPRLQSSLPEFSLREIKLTTEGEKSAQFLADTPHQSLPPAQVEAMMTAIAAERGPASAISTVAADAPAHAAAVPGLEPRLGAPGWDSALGQKVLWMVSQQQQIAELNLNPPGLGPLQVVLSVAGDQASATFVSQQPDVRQALEAALPRLKEMMADSGINLGSTTVSSESPQQQREFDRQGRPGARYDGVGLGTAQRNDMGAGHIRSAGNSLVDTFA